MTSPRKRPDPRKALDAMPSGEPLYRIARDILQALGKWQLRNLREFARIKAAGEPLDPFMAAQNMAAQFIPYISSYIDQGAEHARSDIGLLPADDWMIRNPAALQAARTAAYDLCQETVDAFLIAAGDQIDNLRREAMESIAAGETAGDMVDRMARWFDEDARWRARRIANTESARAFNLGQIVSTEDLDFVAGYKWVLSDDACPMCHAIARMCPVIPKGGQFAQNGKNQTYKNIKLPPAHPNCVLGETPIRVASLVSATHAKYQGPIVRIECSDGSRFAVTANHMLLTASGFARAADLMQGDDIVCTSTTPQGFSAPSIDSPNDDNRPATAEQIFKAFRESGRVTTTSVPVASEYLHGDAAFVNGNIDVIRADGLLWGDADSFLGQPIDHVPLVGGSNFALRFNRQRPLADFLGAAASATDGGMGGLRESDAVLWGSFRHSLEHGFGSITWANANLAKSADDHRARNAQSLRDAFNRFPGFVSTAKIIKIDIEFPQEPVSVYDFETSESMYIIDNGIVSSNCRCTLVTVFDDEVPESWPTPVLPDPETGYIKPAEPDIIAAREGGYQSVEIGNAKSIEGFVALWG